MTNENKISPQQEIYEHGVELAYKANEARDRRDKGNEELAAINVVSEIPGVKVSIGALRSVASEALKAGRDYEDYNNAVGQLIGPQVFEKIDVEPAQDVLSLMTPEQRERADKLTFAMAEQFNLDQADFSILAKETESGEKQFTVVYVAGYGIYESSWDDIFDEANAGRFMIQVEGEQIDTRKGMTLDLYKALPDSPKLRSDEEGNFWGLLLYAGKDKYTLALEYGAVNDPSDEDGIHFRPAVAV